MILSFERALSIEGVSADCLDNDESFVSCLRENDSSCHGFTNQGSTINRSSQDTDGSNDDAEDDEAEEENDTPLDLTENTMLHNFEGPEKNLEMDFVAEVGHPKGCRALTRDHLSAVLREAQCFILSHISNHHMDAYVLSESSLFVYKHKIVIKTCGTTTLLRCIPLVLAFTQALGMQLEWLCYSRKNFSFPENQLHPHSSFTTEVSYLNALIKSGSAYVLGPITQEHWLCYVSDECTPRSTTVESFSNERTLHILMHDLDPNVAQLFHKNAHASPMEMTEKSGIGGLVPGATIDAYAFQPCGYSMNAILFDAYYTIHITPESHCSYASWETNARMASYVHLIRKILKVFRPQSFTMTLYAHRKGLIELAENPFGIECLHLGDKKHVGDYKRTHHSQTHFLESDFVCLMGTWKSIQSTDDISLNAKTLVAKKRMQEVHEKENDDKDRMGSVHANKTRRFKRQHRSLSMV